MGFFKKLAKGLGIGVANVTLEIPAIISKNVWELDGVVTISAESDLLVEKISIEIEETVAETRTQFSGENVYEESFKTKHNLGKTEIGENISMKAGEDQNISFKVPIVSPQFPPEPKQGIFSQSKPPQPSFKAKALVKFGGVIAEQEVSKTFKMEWIHLQGYFFPVVNSKNAPNPALTLTRLSLRFRLGEGRAPNALLAQSRVAIAGQVTRIVGR